MVKDAKGNLVKTVTIPSLKAPVNLVPEWVDVKVAMPKGTDLLSGSVQLDPKKKIVQITRVNDFVKW
jgi:hypothetical protein